MLAIRGFRGRSCVFAAISNFISSSVAVAAPRLLIFSERHFSPIFTTARTKRGRLIVPLIYAQVCMPAVNTGKAHAWRTWVARSIQADRRRDLNLALKSSQSRFCNSAKIPLESALWSLLPSLPSPALPLFSRMRV